MSKGTVSSARRLISLGSAVRFPALCCFGLLSSRRRPIGEKHQEGRIDVEVFPAGFHLLVLRYTDTPLSHSHALLPEPPRPNSSCGMDL